MRNSVPRNALSRACGAAPGPSRRPGTAFVVLHHIARSSRHIATRSSTRLTKLSSPSPVTSSTTCSKRVDFVLLGASSSWSSSPSACCTITSCLTRGHRTSLDQYGTRRRPRPTSSHTSLQQQTAAVELRRKSCVGSTGGRQGAADQRCGML